LANVCVITRRRLFMLYLRTAQWWW